jgi:hypothetical protein
LVFERALSASRSTVDFWRAFVVRALVDRARD